MKRTFIIIAAVCAALTSCSKNIGYLDDNGPAPEVHASDIKLNINVAEIGGGTKAAKTGWVEGDKINIWIDDLDVISLMGDNKGRAELVLTYTSGKWVAVFDEFYKTHTDDKNELDGLFHTIKDEGVLNCLYEGSNDISNYKVDAANYIYTFTPVKWVWKCEKCGEENDFGSDKCAKCDEYKPDGAAPVSNNIIQLMCCADNVPYTYDGTTLTATITGWTVLTMVQVVVDGLDKTKASSYTLSCDNMYSISSITKTYQDNNGLGDFVVSGYDYDVPTLGVSNKDGVAFCFYDVVDQSGDGPFKFTLNDGTTNYVHTDDTNTLITSSEIVKFIKLDKAYFGL
ncbi:MAG: fimbrillin family protein [Bacteroidia bacterium]|nr:fimbrillin family protein [Bacteroidia bacterium]